MSGESDIVRLDTQHTDAGTQENVCLVTWGNCLFGTRVGGGDFVECAGGMV